MMLMRASRAGIWAGPTATASVISWQAAAMTLATVAVSGVLRLLTEWQRRQTFLAVGGPLRAIPTLTTTRSDSARPPDAGTESTVDKRQLSHQRARPAPDVTIHSDACRGA
jgi:hypothetical protein